MKYLTKILLKSVHSESKLCAYLATEEIESFTNSNDNNVIFTIEVVEKALFWDDTQIDNKLALLWIEHIRNREYLDNFFSK